jgi:hypothetical protein
LARLLCVAALAWPASALAQSAGAQAEVMFREGRALLAAGKLAEACAAFAASQKLDPATSTLVNLASCRERTGQLATAWALFLDAERATRGATDAAARKLHRVALDHVKRIEPRLSRLTITVPPASRVAGLEVRRGADPVEPAMWGHALPIDGGTYTVTARAPGATLWTAVVAVAPESDSKVVEVPRPRSEAPAVAAAPAPPAPTIAAAQPAPSVAAAARPAPSVVAAPAVPAAARTAGVAAPAAPAQPAPAVVAAPAAPAKPASSVVAAPAVPAAARTAGVASSRPVRSSPAGETRAPTLAAPIPRATKPRPAAPLVALHPREDQRSVAAPLGFAGGGAGLVIGAVAVGLWGKATYDAARDERTDQRRRDALYDDANTKRHVAIAMGVAGVACGGIAAWLYYAGRGREASAPAPHALRVTPQVGERTGLVISGAF